MPQANSLFAQSLISNWKCFSELQSINIRSGLAHKKDTWFNHIFYLFERLLGLLALFVIFRKIDHINGWNMFEITFLYGMWLVSPSLYRVLFQGVSEMGYLVTHGMIDHILTKPRSPLLMICFYRTNVSGIFDLFMGLGLMLFAAIKLHLAWSVWTIPLLIIFTICANAIIIAIMMSQATASLWFGRFNVIYEIIMSVRELGRYPFGIYHSGIRIFLSIVIPIAFCSYIPAAVLLGKDGFSKNWVVMPPLVAVVALFLSIQLFRMSLKKYQSTGS